MDRTAAYELVREALLSPEERIKALVSSLPLLEKDSEGVDLDEPCPICLMPLSSVFEEEVVNKKGERSHSSHGDVDEEDDQELWLEGVTKLVGCGHIFCRRDLTEWIRSRHGSCPTCRHTFLDIRPPSDSDDESSDGGEYIPNPEDFEDEDEDEDAFLDVDGFTDTDTDDFPVQTMDLDFDEMWEDNDAEYPDGALVEDAEMDDADNEEEEDRGSEWGLTDGESESMSSSEGDMTMGDIDADEERNSVAPEPEVNVSVHEDDEDINNAEQDEGLIPYTLAAADSRDPK